MNNIILQSFRAVAVLAIALFAFVSDVFAAPMLTPATATHITENSAKLVSSVSNPHKSTAVWFELIDGAGAPMAVGVEPPLYDNGINVRFEHNLYNLNPGQTYRFRSVAVEGGATVYSPMSSFTTATPKAASVTVTYQSSSQTVTPPTKATQTVSPVTVGKKTATTTPVVTEEGFTNRNTAAVIGSGSDIFPNTLIGWILLIIAILVAVLVGRMIYESTEKRKKPLDEDRDEEEAEIE